MNYQQFLKSKQGVKIAIFIGQLPPKLGLFISDRIADALASKENSNLVKAIKANQKIICGKNTISHKELKHRVRAVLRHSGRCYYDLYHTFNDSEKILKLFPNSKAIEELITESHSKNGLFILSPHMSNFDLALRAMSLRGLRAKLLGYANPVSGYKIHNKYRASMGIEVIPFSEPNIFSRAVKMLKNGEKLLTGIDRPVEVRKKRHRVSFFGHPSTLPVGYIQIALAADVPIMVMGTKMKPNGQYEIFHSDLIQLKRHANRFTEIKQNVEMVLEIVAKFIRQAPEQWLMFYPVWPEALEELP